MPAPTWHFLKNNDTAIDIPAGLAVRPCVEVDAPYAARGAVDEFENALADAQEAWEAAHPAPTPHELAEREAYRAAEADATYGGTAQSAYQARADQIEDERSLAAAFEHGMGDEAAAFLRYAAGERVVVVADEGKSVDARVAVAGASGTMSVAAVDVVAGAGSRVRLSLVVADGDGAGCGADSGSPALPGIAGTTVRVFADEGAQVVIARMQTLGDEAVDIDDMALFVGAGARIDVRQTVLGACASYCGLACDLRGDGGRIDADTRYLAQGSQTRDFNFSVRHHGMRTVSNLAANGVLAGESSKSLRATIDLVRGCKGAQGSETESVLLVDERVSNKTVPVILCNEDDVAGNHGATIGHIRPEQLFYLQSRGLTAEAAERMFAFALVEQAVVDADDETARASASRFGERLSQRGFIRTE